MKPKPFLLIISFLCLNHFISAQNDKTSLVDSIDLAIRGIVYDGATNLPLPYTNIFIDNHTRGVISNEKGLYAIDISGLGDSDSICFQYLGYKMLKVSLNQARINPEINLFEDDINLSDIVIFGNPPDPKKIVEKVLQNKEKNYPPIYSKMNAFIRDRETSTVKDLKINYKKSTIDNIDRKLVEDLERSIPRHTTSYTDFLGDLYFGKPPLSYDSIVKVDGIKAVVLKEKDMADMERIEKVMEESFVGLNPDEYWRLKSGILAVKVDEGQPAPEEKGDSTLAVENENIEKKEKTDSLSKDELWLKYYSYSMDWKFHFPKINGKSDWEFLYEPNRYNYKLEGGTRVGGEDVYIISFTPKYRGEYIGKMYITANTFALIRADYQYGEGKDGTDFDLLGIDYCEDQFFGSILFEKKGERYALKYFSKKTGSTFSIDRPFGFVKKRKRFMLDKKLCEIKVKLSLAVKTENLVEVLIIDENEISEKEFVAFEPEREFELQRVDRFDDKLWAGHTIIEPTKQMKEYKKQAD